MNLSPTRVTSCCPASQSGAVVVVLCAVWSPSSLQVVYYCTFEINSWHNHHSVSFAAHTIRTNSAINNSVCLSVCHTILRSVEMTIKMSKTFVAWKFHATKPANRNARSKQWQPWLAVCQRKRLRFLRFSFTQRTQRTQRKRLRLNRNRALLCIILLCPCTCCSFQTLCQRLQSLSVYSTLCMLFLANKAKYRHISNGCKGRRSRVRRMEEECAHFRR